MKESCELLALRHLCRTGTFTKQEIARAIGISYQTLNNFLKGDRPGRQYNFNRVKNFFRAGKTTAQGL